MGGFFFFFSLGFFFPPPPPPPCNRPGDGFYILAEKFPYTTEEFPNPCTFKFCPSICKNCCPWSNMYVFLSRYVYRGFLHPCDPQGKEAACYGNIQHYLKSIFEHQFLYCHGDTWQKNLINLIDFIIESNLAEGVLHPLPEQIPNKVCPVLMVVHL